MEYKDYYQILGVDKKSIEGRDKKGLQETGAQIPPRCESKRQRNDSEICGNQRSSRGVVRRWSFPKGRTELLLQWNRRQGDDLFTEVPVNVYTAMLGGDLDVHTLSGAFKLKITPETQSGTTFRLKGRGFPRYGKKTSSAISMCR